MAENTGTAGKLIGAMTAAPPQKHVPSQLDCLYVTVFSANRNKPAYEKKGDGIA